MTYILRSQFGTQGPRVGLTYIPADDVGLRPRAFLGSDGNRYGWRDVTNAAGDVFSRKGVRVDNLNVRARLVAASQNGVT